MLAPWVGEPRITFTASVLLNARSIYLHIEGQAKRAVFERALAQGPVAEMPVRAVLRTARERLTVFWCS
jgi:6-phosphogluconolactonase